MDEKILILYKKFGVKILIEKCASSLEQSIAIILVLKAENTNFDHSFFIS